jgi:hypothetical protein
MDDHRLPLISSVGQSNLTDPTAIFFKNLAYPKHVVDFTLNNKGDDSGDSNATKVSWLRNTQTARYHVKLTLFSLIGFVPAGSDKPSLTIVESSRHTLFAMTASASSLSKFEVCAGQSRVREIDQSLSVGDCTPRHLGPAQLNPQLSLYS